MRTTFHFPLLLLLLGGLATAQGVTSPRGFLATEGNMTFAHFGGSRRFQQIDYTHAGAPMVIQSISWRRNGSSTGAAGTRTFDFQVDLGRCNFGVVSQLLDNNYLPASRTNVFNQTGVLFPDWSAALPGPTPFDFTVMLSAPYVYTGVDALVIDFSYTNNTSSSSYSVDREFNGLTTPPAGTALGTGCVATGRNAAFSHTAYMSNHDPAVTTAYGMRLRLGGNNAPSTSPIVLALIDATNPALSGLLCTTLQAGPMVTLPLAALATGLVPDVSFGFTHDAALVGATLYTQLAAPDAGQAPIAVALSNGRRTSMTGNVETGSHRCSYGWYSLPTTTGTATHFIGGGMVMRLQ